jgi:hypothetical protein
MSLKVDQKLKISNVVSGESAGINVLTSVAFQICTALRCHVWQEARQHSVISDESF